MKGFVLASIVAVSAASVAKADGFVCTSAQQHLKVQAYNYTSPELGTRRGAVLILSRTDVRKGRTVARFNHVENNLSSEGAAYTAKVDLRFNNTNKGSLVLNDLVIDELSQVRLTVEFKYGDNLAEGDSADGSLALYLRDGQVLPLPVSCERYLKGE